MNSFFGRVRSLLRGLVEPASSSRGPVAPPSSRGPDSGSDPPLSPDEKIEQAALLAAIASAIDDDDPRLVYADWLEERGGASRVARAEFIRWQCRYPRDEIRWSNHGSSGNGRGFQLFYHWEPAWVAELRAFEARYEDEYYVESAVWRRGFVERLDAWGVPERSNDASANAGPLLRELHCLTSVTHADSARFRTLAESGDLANLRSLTLSGDQFELEGLVALTCARPALKLERLALHWGRLSLVGLETILAAPFATRLQRFTTAWTEIGDAHLVAIARTPVFRSLRVLRLVQTQATDAGVRALARASHLSRLVALEIGGAAITAAAKRELTESRAFAPNCEIKFD